MLSQTMIKDIKNIGGEFLNGIGFNCFDVRLNIVCAFLLPAYNFLANYETHNLQR